MYEWMCDDTVLRGLQAHVYKNKTIEDCIKFIRESNDESVRHRNCHMAIVDENDVYQGTVSLKKIDHGYKDAEFALVLRRESQKHGYAHTAMKEILEIAFTQYKLDEVYWNVLKNNDSAIRLYERMGCQVLKNVSERRMAGIPRRADGKAEDVFFYYITEAAYRRLHS
ncbi:MAG: GNAT family N-acetyltransferase [Butyrivibrio sp.]|nr:GNAT family N-acetyltransferase [Acetatifactor muris]MCM1559464.1 GNAT family N-acetyltransferase [Butyrivibrio sp.]